MPEKIDLVLIKPGGRINLFGNLTLLSGFAPPLDIGLIAAFIKEKGYAVRIIDADAEFLTPLQTAVRVVQCNPVLAGIFVHTIRMGHASQTIKELRKKAPHIKILLGGRHPSALPEKTLSEEKVDFVIQGEAFFPVFELLKLLKSKKETRDYKIKGIWYLKNSKVAANSCAPLIKDLDKLPFMAWGLLPMDSYRAHNWQCFEDPQIRKPYAIIYTSLGCPFHCSYCNVNAVYGDSVIRFRSPQRVIAELDYLVSNYKIKYLRIVDDIFTLKPARVMRICDLIIQRGYDLNIWCYARVDTVNELILKKMKQAGINWICYGIEAGRQEVRQGVFKRIKPDKIKKAIEATRSAGIHIIGNFIFGLPDDNLETMQETLNMAKEFNFEYVNFYAAMPWPGSKLYEEAVRGGIKLPESWDGYSQLSQDTLPLPTKYLTASQVLDFRDRAFEEYFNRTEYFKMIREKFGESALVSVQNMLKNKIKRKHTLVKT